MKIDIKFKQKGFFYDWFTKHDIKEPNVIVNDNFVVISFYTERKGIKRHYEYSIPRDNFGGVAIRRTLDKDGN
jgi:hypothetical protein